MYQDDQAVREEAMYTTNLMTTIEMDLDGQ
jgi:hypothetical protein